MPALTSTEGKAFRLDITGYQFGNAGPSDRDGEKDWDSNWLVIRIHVDDGARNWHGASPALTTWEARALIDWLLNDAVLLPSSEFVETTEPCIRAVRSKREDDQIRLLIELSHEFAPLDWEEFKPITVALNVNVDSVREFGAQLGQQLQRFPER